MEGLNFPISLGYHASGIKENEVATSVGLGWSLFAGGTITRTINYRPDGYKNGTGNYDYSYSSANSIDKLIKNEQYGIVRDLVDNNPGLRDYDLEYDRYSYQFVGRSGVFRYSKNKKTYINLNYDPMDIMKEDRGFIIVDGDGIVYHFQEEEVSGYTEGDENVVRAPTIWHLSEIDTPTDTIFIHYFQEKEFFTIDYSEVFKVFIEHNDNLAANPSGDYYTSNTFSNISRYKHKQKLVKKIEWKQGRVEFFYLDDRKDVFS